MAVKMYWTRFMIMLMIKAATTHVDNNLGQFDGYWFCPWFAAFVWKTIIFAIQNLLINLDYFLIAKSWFDKNWLTDWPISISRKNKRAKNRNISKTIIALLHSLHTYSKNCQNVGGISMTRQFHNFSTLKFWRVFY